MVCRSRKGLLASSVDPPSDSLEGLAESGLVDVSGTRSHFRIRPYRHRPGGRVRRTDPARPWELDDEVMPVRCCNCR